MQSSGVDSTYSWIVAGSCFFLYMMMYGVYRLSGIMFVASMPRFGVGREAASFPYTFAGFTKNVAGPLVGILLHKFRIRTLILFGCALAAVGIGTCFFAENIFVVTVLWGIVYGFGFALSCSLLPVLINQHFVKHRATAAGIAFSGMCVGSMIFPLIVEVCIDFYGISGTFLILSGLVLNCIPLGIFLRERILNNKVDKKKSMTKRNRKPKSVSFSTETTPLTSGQLQKNVLLYSSITKGSPNSSSGNRNIEDFGEKMKNNEPKIDISNVSDNSKLQKPTLICSDLGKEEVRNNLEGLGASFNPSEVHTITNINKEEALEYQQLLKEPKISIDKSSDKDDILYENSNIYEPTVCEDSSYHVTKKDSTHQNNDNKMTLNGKTISKKIPDISSSAQHRKYKDKDEFFKNNNHSKTFSGTQIAHLEKDSTNEKSPLIPNNSENKVNVYDGLKNEVQDSTCVVIPKYPKKGYISEQTAANSNKSGKSICRGHCTLLLSFTYIVVLFTKTLSNSITLCVNTVIFDYSRDIGITVENEKYLLIFSSVGELIGRLCLGRITDSHCLSKSMFMVVCSLGQALGALCIAWSTGFYVLSAGLFIYSFMGSVVQFMCPLIIADGIAEDKQAFAITSSSFLAGPASLVISPLIGYLRDEIGTYTYLFYGISILCVLTGIMWLIGYFVMKPRNFYTKIK